MAILREIAAVRERAGIWARHDHTVLRFAGKDAAAWLHNQTTNTVTSLEDGQGNQHALLDRTGRVQAFFSLHRWQDEVWAIIESQQVAALMQRLDTHLFLEDVSVTDVGEHALQICVEGPRALLFMEKLLQETGSDTARLPRQAFAFAPISLLGFDVLAFAMTETEEDGFLLVPAPADAAALWQHLRDRAPEWGIEEVGEAARLTVRLESGFPRFGADIDKTVVISECPLEQYTVSYDKGCYLGQEVVARLKTYGSPKQALVGLIIPDEAAMLPGNGATLYVAGKKVGQMRSSAYSPTLAHWIAYAYLDRDHRVPGAALHLHSEEHAAGFEAQVVHLPFYQPLPRRIFAENLYQEALGLFEADLKDEDDTAIELLKEALVLAPEFEDAYEVLGVILHRHGRVDEAVEQMRKLAELNPASIMAHTNLSVFYMTQGLIQEAEEEKAKAAQLEMRQDLDARQAERAAESERARIRQDAEERVQMFLEVLDIDPEDPIATMGIGSAYMQLEDHAKALPYFETATRVKKDYSAAFLNLGKCREFLGDADGARQAYLAGIEAASRKGDLMPLREMERRLKTLA